MQNHEGGVFSQLFFFFKTQTWHTVTFSPYQNILNRNMSRISQTSKAYVTSKGFVINSVDNCLGHCAIYCQSKIQKKKKKSNMNLTATQKRI